MVELVLGYDVVYNLTKDLQGKNSHAFYDNYFTGVKLADDLLVQKIYTCRTIKINRIGCPVELKGLKIRIICSIERKCSCCSTLSDPRLQINVKRKVGRNNIQCNQALHIFITRKLMESTGMISLGLLMLLDDMGKNHGSTFPGSL